MKSIYYICSLFLLFIFVSCGGTKEKEEEKKENIKEELAIVKEELILKTIDQKVLNLDKALGVVLLQSKGRFEVKISWATDDPKLINLTSGKIAKVKDEIKVKLTATLAKGGLTDTKVFLLTLPSYANKAASVLKKNIKYFLNKKKNLPPPPKIVTEDQKNYKLLKKVYHPASSIKDVIESIKTLEGRNKTHLVDIAYLLNAPHNRVLAFTKTPSKYVSYSGRFKSYPGSSFNGKGQEIVVGYDGRFYYKKDGNLVNAKQFYFAIDQYGKIFIKKDAKVQVSKIFCEGKITLENGFLRKIDNEGTYNNENGLTKKDRLDGVILLFQIQEILYVMPEALKAKEVSYRLVYGYSLYGTDCYSYKKGPDGSVPFTYLQTRSSNFLKARVQTIKKETTVYRGMHVNASQAKSLFATGMEASAFYNYKKQLLNGDSKPLNNLLDHQEHISTKTLFNSTSLSKSTAKGFSYTGCVFKIRLKPGGGVRLAGETPDVLSSEQEVSVFWRINTEDIEGFWDSLNNFVSNPNFKP